MNSTKKIIHIDMDCFYAAIEMRDFPELKHKPIAVGGDAKRRGVIATCNYLARKFGVRSAMPTAHALKLCPDLVLQPVRMNIYKEESQYIQAIFSEYTDLIEPLSLDEAYLDVSDCSHCHGSATWIAEEIRARIFQTRGITASAGIAPNKSLAKIASDLNKPNGQKVILPENIDSFILDLPVRKLFGVGPKMEEKLKALKIETCIDLQKLPMEELCQKFGSMGQKLYELARGIDERPVNPHRIRKSISVEKTYLKDLSDVNTCLAELPKLVNRLEDRIDLSGKSTQISGLFVKLKFNNFQQTTVERTCDNVDSSILGELIQEGFSRKLIPVRLLGIGIKLKQKNDHANVQLTLFDGG